MWLLTRNKLQYAEGWLDLLVRTFLGLSVLAFDLSADPWDLLVTCNFGATSALSF